MAVLTEDVVREDVGPASPVSQDRESDKLMPASSSLKRNQASSTPWFGKSYQISKSRGGLTSPQQLGCNPKQLHVTSKPLAITP